VTGPALLDVRHHPVKSLRGDSRPSLAIAGDGVADDRRWALVADGRPLSAKRVPALLLGAARMVDGAAEITLPDGTATSTAAADVDAVLSRWLGRPVTLVEAPAADRWVDDAPVHLLTTSSLAAMRARHEGSWDPLRFRCNLLVEVPGAEGLVEQSWVGRTLAVGEVVLEVLEPTVRCAMTSAAQAGVPEDRGILRTLVDANDASLGVYARVVRGGVVRVGDALDVG
jgi:uncharacterized protein